jgi:hypothetical protein
MIHNEDQPERKGKPVAERCFARRSRATRAAICVYVTGMYRGQRKKDKLLGISRFLFIMME